MTMMRAPEVAPLDASSIATLRRLMGVDAPWYYNPSKGRFARRNDRTSGERSTTQLHAQDLVRQEHYYSELVKRTLTNSTKTDYFLSAVVWALCRQAALRSTRARALIRKYAPAGTAESALTQSYISQQLSKAIAMRLTQRVQESNVSKIVAALSKQRADWLRLHGAAGRPQWELRPGGGAGVMEGKQVTDGAAVPNSAESPPPPSDSSAADAEQQLHDEWARILAELSQQRALLEVSPEVVELRCYELERDSFWARYGLLWCESRFRSAERRESERSRVDGATTESDVVASAAGRAQLLVLVRRNAQQMVDLGILPRHSWASLLEEITEAEFRDFFEASAKAEWSSVHDRLANRLHPAAGGQTPLDNSERWPPADPAMGFGTAACVAVDSVSLSPVSLSPDLSHTRRQFHARCVRHRIPHLVVLQSAKYTCSIPASNLKVNGELDVVVADLCNERVLLVVEAKASPGDLVKAKQQGERLSLVVRACLTKKGTSTATTDNGVNSEVRRRGGSELGVVPGMVFSCSGTIIPSDSDGADAGNNSSGPVECCETSVVAQGSSGGVEVELVVAAEDALSPRFAESSDTAGASVPSPSTDPPLAVQGTRENINASAVNKGTKRLGTKGGGPEVPAAVHHRAPSSVVRLSASSFEGATQAGLGGTNLTTFFVYATSIRSSERKSPYYSGMGHLVLREVSAQLVTVLIHMPSVAAFLTKLDDLPDEEPTAQEQQRRHLHFDALRHHIEELLLDDTLRESICGSMDAESITSALRRAWLSEVEKSATPTQSFFADAKRLLATATTQGGVCVGGAPESSVPSADVGGSDSASKRPEGIVAEDALVAPLRPPQEVFWELEATKFLDLILL